MNLATLNDSIVLANEETSDDAFGMLLSAITVNVAKLREMKAAVEAKMVEKIKATGQDIVIGPVRYYVGKEKKTKCLDYAGTVNAILAACGGDVDRLAGCLASDAFKHGTVRALFEEFEDADSFRRLFETVEVEDLKTGKPTKKLLSVNTAFAG